MLENLGQNRRVYSCRVREVMADLDDKDKLIFENALATKGWGAATLSRQLRDLGIHIADSSITRHRQGNCSCSKISK